ncbi:hypothetical protein V6N13_110484 [Hibiscus sabdariffa]
MLLTKLEELSRITSGIWLEKLCPSKVEAFLWKVVHGRVATHVELVNEDLATMVFFVANAIGVSRKGK